MKSFSRLLATLLLLQGLPLSIVRAEQSLQPTASETVAPADSSDTDVEPSKNISADTLVAIERVKQQASQAEQLSPEAKAEILEACDKAAAKLEDASKLEATTSKLQKELETAASVLEELQAKATKSAAEDKPVAEVSSEELRGQLSAADQAVSAAREKLHKITSEIERRTERRKTLPDLLAESRAQLSSVMEGQKQPEDAQRPLLSEARKLYLAARRVFREQELKSLEQENRTYEATSRLWLARRDNAEKKLQLVIEKHKAVEKLVAEMQRRDAQRQAQEARRSAINVHPAIQEAAAINADLAERNQKLVGRMQTIQKNLAEARELAENIRQRLDDVTKRAEKANYSPAIGVMLRSQQDQLPVLGTYRRRLHSRPVEISKLDLETFEWDSQRREALLADKAVDSSQIEVEAAELAEIREEIATELRHVIKTRIDILAELTSNADACMSRLNELGSAESEVIQTTEQLESFIAEHVLWVRSAPSLSLSELKRATSTWEGWPSTLEQARMIPDSLWGDVKQHSLQWSLATVLLLALVSGRGRIRRELRSTGNAAAKPTATLFRPTVEAALATILLAAPAPLFLGFIGWRLCQASVGLPHATGWALLLFSTVYAMLDLVRHSSRSGGLGTNHFGWEQKGLGAIRRAARSLQLLALPLLAIAGGIEVAHGESMMNTIGRLSLITALLVIGVVCCRLFRASGPLASSLATNAKGWGIAQGLMKVIIPVSVFAVVGLIAASGAGYHYTAMQLTRRVFVSCVFVFACLALRSLLMRWLLVAYRRVAMQQAREKRKALLEAQESSTAEAPVVETQPQVNLNNINQQARKLVGVGASLAFVASMWFIWSDVLPALGVFSRVELWASGLVSLDPDAGTVFVTLTDLIVAIAIFALTWFAGSNLPGLLEMAVLRKLPLDAGARYAASSVTRYTIVVVGAALCMRQLGVGWQSVQWLVAAMTVGLGFGLQEIFANFVSGIILLFERPARVGDTVTVGSITGTVTKIRIRATTILDWDNKELIVPNKEFVTGNLVNWTLSNPNLRLVLKVGVAYGSDTRLATELLYKVASECPNVLNSPEPSVVFNEFGDSSLNFELRLFVSDLSLYRSLRHELHMSIDDLFRKHGIEIAFPQCDLHIKSMPVAAQASVPAERQNEIFNANDVAA